MNAQNNIDDTQEIADLRKKLLFRAWHRGTREADLIVGSFAKKYINSFTQEQVMQFQDLLSLSDPDIYNWITGREEIPSNVDTPVLRMLKDHQYTHEREFTPEIQ